MFTLLSKFHFFPFSDSRNSQKFESYYRVDSVHNGQVRAIELSVLVFLPQLASLVRLSFCAELQSVTTAASCWRHGIVVFANRWELA